MDHAHHPSVLLYYMIGFFCSYKMVFAKRIHTCTRINKFTMHCTVYDWISVNFFFFLVPGKIIQNSPKGVLNPIGFLVAARHNPTGNSSFLSQAEFSLFSSMKYIHMQMRTNTLMQKHLSSLSSDFFTIMQLALLWQSLKNSVITH